MRKVRQRPSPTTDTCAGSGPGASRHCAGTWLGIVVALALATSLDFSQAQRPRVCSGPPPSTASSRPSELNDRLTASCKSWWRGRQVLAAGVSTTGVEPHSACLRGVPPRACLGDGVAAGEDLFAPEGLQVKDSDRRPLGAALRQGQQPIGLAHRHRRDALALGAAGDEALGAGVDVEEHKAVAGGEEERALLHIAHPVAQAALRPEAVPEARGVSRLRGWAARALGLGFGAPGLEGAHVGRCLTGDACPHPYRAGREA